MAPAWIPDGCSLGLIIQTLLQFSHLQMAWPKFSPLWLPVLMLWHGSIRGFNRIFAVAEDEDDNFGLWPHIVLPEGRQFQEIYQLGPRQSRHFSGLRRLKRALRLKAWISLGLFLLGGSYLDSALAAAATYAAVYLSWGWVAGGNWLVSYQKSRQALEIPPELLVVPWVIWPVHPFGICLSAAMLLTGQVLERIRQLQVDPYSRPGPGRR